jgi:DNA polymerase-4
MKHIILVDMDAFFASVEQQSNPALRGKPIGVVGRGKRTVITTASYEARAFGVKTGMTVPEALKLCPHLIIVEGNNAKYTYTCQRLSELYQRYTPSVEVYSVDEAFLDVTGSAHLFGGPEKLAKRIKEDIRKLFGLKATVGIGHNRLVAKMAAELSKPDGLRRITPEEVPEVWKSLPVEQLWGVGPALARRLNALGIKTAYELGRTPLTVLKAHFGLTGVHLKALGLGLDPSERHCQQGPRTIGHSTTLPRDIEDEKEIKQVILRLSEMVGSRARRHGYEGRTVVLTVRSSSFTTITRRRTLNAYTNDTHIIYQRALEIFKEIDLSEPVRLLGVALSGLRPVADQPVLLPEIERKRRLLRTLDRINDKHGAFTVCWAGTVTDLFHSGVISPAWRPSGLRRSL